MKWKFGWEAQLFLTGRRDRKHSAASTASFKNHLFSSCSFLANEHWQKITAASSTSGPFWAWGRARFTTHPGEFPNLQRGGSSRGDCLSAAAAICSVTCGDKGHPLRVTQDISPKAGSDWDGRKDRYVLLLHRAAAWKTRSDGFKHCLDPTAP